MARKPLGPTVSSTRRQQDLDARPILSEARLDGGRSVAITQLSPDPQQPRRTFDDASLEELAHSIRQEGVLQPLLVREEGLSDEGTMRYCIIAGERRWRAALIAGIDRLPVVVRDITDPATIHTLQIMENVQREDLNAADRGRALLQLKETLGLTWIELGQRLGLTERRVLQLANVARLPAHIQDHVRQGRLTEKQTRVLKGLSPDKQEAIATAVSTGRLTGDSLARIAARLKANATLSASEIIDEATTVTPATRAVQAAATIRQDETEPGFSVPPVQGRPYSEEKGEPLSLVKEQETEPGFSPGMTVEQLARVVESLAQTVDRPLSPTTRQQWERIHTAVERILS